MLPYIYLSLGASLTRNQAEQGVKRKGGNCEASRPTLLIISVQNHFSYLGCWSSFWSYGPPGEAGLLSYQTAVVFLTMMFWLLGVTSGRDLSCPCSLRNLFTYARSAHDFCDTCLSCCPNKIWGNFHAENTVERATCLKEGHCAMERHQGV